MNNKNHGKRTQKGDPMKNANPNARVKEIKARYGAGYDYKFLEMENLQREFYFEMQRREKEGKHRK